MWTPGNSQPPYFSWIDARKTNALSRSLKVDGADAANKTGLAAQRLDGVNTLDVMVRPPIPLQHFAAPGLQQSNVVVDLAERAWLLKGYGNMKIPGTQIEVPTWGIVAVGAAGLAAVLLSKKGTSNTATTAGLDSAAVAGSMDNLRSDLTAMIQGLMYGDGSQIPVNPPELPDSEISPGGPELGFGPDYGKDIQPPSQPPVKDPGTTPPAPAGPPAGDNDEPPPVVPPGDLPPKGQGSGDILSVAMFDISQLGQSDPARMAIKAPPRSINQLTGAPRRLAYNRLDILGDILKHGKQG